MVEAALARRLIHRLWVLWERPDFRQNPLKAIAKRVVWRARWRLRAAPWELRMGGGFRILVPHSGAGALIFYQGLSEPRTAELICRFLQPGMVFWDIGAHIGEYTVLAAARVGELGEVHAFEPNPEAFELLERNVALSCFTHVVLNQVAVADVTGELAFRIEAEPTVSRIERGAMGESSERLIRVRSLCLEEYARGRRGPHLIEIDTEGAEGVVLRGMSRLLARPVEQAPVLVFEYSPANYGAFGYDAWQVLELLFAAGYEIYLPTQSGLVPLESTAVTSRVLENNLWAAKGSAHLTRLLSECSATGGCQ